jgi:hypothetical protein
MTRSSVVRIALGTLILGLAATGDARSGQKAPAGHDASRGALVAELRDALVHGDLPGAQAQAATIALGPADGAVADGFARLRATTNLADGADALGQVAVACAGCHAAAGVVPKPEGAAPPVGDGVRAEMARHDLAMDQLWTGMIFDLPDERHDAAEAFDASVLQPIEGATVAVEELDAAVSSAALAVDAAPDAATRADRFGDLVVTCASCHLLKPGGIHLEPE